MLKTPTLKGGLLFGGLKPFSLCLSVKRQSWTTPQTSVPVMAISPCLSRERQSWGACDSLFPLPVEEKDCRGTLQGSVAGVRTELRRALKGSAGLCKASWLGIAFPSTGRGKWASQARSGVSSISKLREAPFPRQAEGKGFKPPRIITPPWRWGFEHVEASECVFSWTGKRKKDIFTGVGR